MIFTLHIWRQQDSKSDGYFELHEIDVEEGTSFLEMLDALNEQLIVAGKEAIAFDFDCREGVCGSCNLVINGTPHGKHRATTTCQQYMRDYADEKELWIEPWRATAFPIIKDLIVDRTAFEKIIQAGGYIDIRTGSAPEANTMPIAKQVADEAFDSATCIGCGACVAVCPNASATLFVAAKVSHLSSLPQGQMDNQRAKKMLIAMEGQGFGSCSNYRECERVCPKEISVSNITTMNKLLYQSS
ncbi:MAG: succinate dehydrogenase/fumarate reductase iron-sulfur subunit [Pseudomonadota bacterium]|nr:succinate dehydrogenase/fumarate reductase iron-sulfur subunit [Pseudomonadota bacterium]MDO7666861.1 succinate dehydrogenase/fumarate reductase iron-sulfur subunit [Pseudomonadota bacterium]MDO7711575.1 succinate dehydrogenase/fumarate reductase iron-sulfur subunit [Pseudomonadota bacterium]